MLVHKTLDSSFNMFKFRKAHSISTKVRDIGNFLMVTRGKYPNMKLCQLFIFLHIKLENTKTPVDVSKPLIIIRGGLDLGIQCIGDT